MIPPFFTHSPAKGFKKENGKPHLSNEKQGYDVRPWQPSVQGYPEITELNSFGSNTHKLRH
jgi:hypothetical protein